MEYHINKNILKNDTEDDGELLKDDQVSINIHSNEDKALPTYASAQDWILHHLHSMRYQICVVTLVALDTFIVILELLLELEYAHTPGPVNMVPGILHSISISLLCLFVIEIFIKLYAYRRQFFTMKAELFDAIVVIVALSLDIVAAFSHDEAFAGTGLIIALRLWRIVRIQNSIVVSVRRSGEKRLSREREIRKSLEIAVEETKDKNTQLRRCCRDLLTTLEEKGVNRSSLTFTIPELDVES